MNILAVLEQRGGAWNRMSFETLAAAQQLGAASAAILGQSLDALATEILERKALDLILENAEYEDVPIGKQEEEKPVATVEEQAVPGELRDPTAVPPAPPDNV